MKFLDTCLVKRTLSTSVPVPIYADSIVTDTLRAVCLLYTLNGAELRMPMCRC